MSSPTSLKMMHPLYIDPKIRKKHIIGYIIHIWLSFVPAVFFEVGYWKFWTWSVSFFAGKNFAQLGIWVPIILFPFNLLAAYYILIISSIIIMKIRLMFLHLRHKAREGIFPRDIKNRDYKFHSYRNLTRIFPSYLISSTPFPWMRRILYFLPFGIKIGKNGKRINRDVWITPEFVEIGKNVIIGHCTAILSSYIENDKLIIKNIKIGDNSIIGAKVTLLSGINIEKNAIISAGSYVLPFQNITENSIYYGNPAKFVRKRNLLDIYEKNTSSNDSE
ncbi:MAG: acyltransferase [Promethearchaeota archaeon]